jgi:hypothetical protein
MKTMKYDGVDSVIKSANSPQERPRGKVFGEMESRQRLMAVATQMGCQEEVIQIFNRYDRLLRNCGNEIERKHISILGIAEISKVMGYSGAQTVGDLQIGDEQPETD